MTRPTHIKLLSAFAVMLMMFGAFMVLNTSDESDAATNLGTYMGGTNSSSTSSLYSKVDVQVQDVQGTIYVALGSYVWISGDTNSYSYYLSANQTSATNFGLSFSGSGMDSGYAYGNVQSTGSFVVNYEKVGSSTVYSINITVVSVTRVSSITLSGDSTVYVGESITITGTSSSGAFDRRVSFSGSNSSIATVSSSTTATGGTAVIKGVSAGTITLTAKSVDQAKTVTKTITVKEKALVESITINVTPGPTATLTVSVTPSNAYNPNVTWEVQGSSAYLSGSTGSSVTVVPCGYGMVNIDAISTDGSGVTAFKGIYVGQLTFNAGSGYGAPDPIYYAASTNMSRSVTIPDGASHGSYEFMGWATSSGGHPSYEIGDSYSIKCGENRTLYAIYGMEHDLTFERNGGSGSVPDVDPVMIVEGGQTTFTIPSSGYTLYRNNYYLAGWDTDPSGQTVQCVPGEDVLVRFGYDITLYAVWKQYTFVLSFDTQGGSPQPSNITKMSGNASESLGPIPSYTMVKSGYSFIGWSDASGGSTSSDVDYSVGDYVTVPPEGKTIYAVWESIPTYTYTVTYDANGGSGAPSSDSYGPTTDTSHSFTLSTVKPVWENHTFRGWSTSRTGSTVTSLTLTSSSPSGTVYAIWTEDPKNTFSIQYDLNGGSGTIDGDSYSSYESVHAFTVTSSIPAAPIGCEFAGWSASRDGSVQYVGGDSVSVQANGSVTLYAVYNTIDITVSGTPVLSVKTGTSWTYEPTVSIDDHTLSVSGADWITVVNGTLVGTPTVAGAYTITITASSDGYNPGTQTFTITVVPVLSWDSLPTGGAIAYAI